MISTTNANLMDHVPLLKGTHHPITPKFARLIKVWWNITNLQVIVVFRLLPVKEEKNLMSMINQSYVRDMMKSSRRNMVLLVGLSFLQSLFQLALLLLLVGGFGATGVVNLVRFVWVNNVRY